MKTWTVLLVFSSPSSMLPSKKDPSSVLHAQLLAFHNQKSFGITIKVYASEMLGPRSDHRFSLSPQLFCYQIDRTSSKLFYLVPLKNGEDYQYKVNGTIYSLNMDECFREDEGIYTIRLAIPFFHMLALGSYCGSQESQLSLKIFN